MTKKSDMLCGYPSQILEGVTLMKKRLLTAALVALLPLSLAACGGQSKQAACQIINDKASRQLMAWIRATRKT